MSLQYKFWTTSKQLWKFEFSVFVARRLFSLGLLNHWESAEPEFALRNSVFFQTKAWSSILGGKDLNGCSEIYRFSTTETTKWRKFPLYYFFTEIEIYKLKIFKFQTYIPKCEFKFCCSLPHQHVLTKTWAFQN